MWSSGESGIFRPGFHVSHGELVNLDDDASRCDEVGRFCRRECRLMSSPETGNVTSVLSLLCWVASCHEFTTSSTRCKCVCRPEETLCPNFKSYLSFLIPILPPCSRSQGSYISRSLEQLLRTSLTTVAFRRTLVVAHCSPIPITCG